MKVAKLAALSCALMFSLCAAAAGMEETFKQAAAAFKAGNYQQAGELFVKAGDLAVKDNPQQAGMIWGNAAVALIKADNYADAAATYEKILKINGLKAEDKLKYAKNLFYCYGQLQQNARLIQAINAFIKANPKLAKPELAQLYATLGDAQRDLENYASAVAAYRQALQLGTKQDDASSQARILTAMALCQGNLGDFTAAVENLQQAQALAAKLNQAQTLTDTLSNLGVLSWECGDYPQALQSLTAALDNSAKAKLERNIGVDKNNLSLVYKSMGDHSRAMQLVNESLNIAKQVKNQRDEGIAVVNRALLYRIAGNYAAAAADYSAAVKLFKQVEFKEGLAGAYLGLGRMAIAQAEDYAKAQEYYLQALQIYQDLNLQRGQAETQLQLGLIYKHFTDDAVAVPGTRDLVFEDESAPQKPAVVAQAFNKYKPLLSKPEALAKLKASGEVALKLAERMGAKEFFWAAHQALGYAAMLEGKYQDSFAHYKQAIDTVTGLYVSVSDAEMFGEYMADKEDLYTEAQTVCGILYDETKDQSYLDSMLRYGQTLQNEIHKASAALANLSFEDPNKQELYTKLQRLSKERASAQRAVPTLPELAPDASAENQAQHQLKQQEVRLQQKRIEQLNGEYEQILAQWKEQYPADENLFESAARVDIKMVQQHITPQDVVLMYTSLPERLLITAIAADKVACTAVDVGSDYFTHKIRDEFSVGYIAEGYGRQRYKKGYSKQQGEQALTEITALLQELYANLIKPVEDSLQGKKRIYVISDGFLSQLPFGALSSGMRADGTPQFLVDDYELAYLRPSFINVLQKEFSQSKPKTLFAMANADNANFMMPLLPGTVNEIASVVSTLPGGLEAKDFALEEKFKENPNQLEKARAQGRVKKAFPLLQGKAPAEPTETWVRSMLNANNYEIIYFATHGMPYSNVYNTYLQVKSYLDKNKYDFEQLYAAGVKQGKIATPPKMQGKPSKLFSMAMTIMATKEKLLHGTSPLNGFLYLSSEPGKNFYNSKVTAADDGLLTLRDIIQLSDKSFAKTRYVILSACNTAVTYVPDALASGMDEDGTFSSAEIDAELKAQGYLPGVDQVSFIDTFMRKGVQNVYGTLWFVDDNASAEIMSRFMANLVKQQQPDAVAAYNAAQRSILADARADRPASAHFKQNPREMLHPFLWAPGALFGK